MSLRGSLRLVCLFAGGLVFASVFAYAVLSALKPADEVLASPMQLLPSEWRWSNFTLPFEQAPFERYYLNSVVVGVSVTLLNVLTCTLAGYSFAKFSYRGRNLLFFLVLATLMIPA
jgi:multiple sugar transport system permease protein